MPSLASTTNSLPSSTSLYFRTLEGRIALVVGASALMALSAHVSVPLPFTPVPLTLQTFAVLLIGFLLGPTMGFLSLAAYLLEGACGLPVFSPHSPLSGMAQLMGPTGGYLLSYPFMAAIAGYFSRVKALNNALPLAYAVGGVAATALLFACGAGWLMAVTHISFHAAFVAAIAPFLPGEIVKIVAAAGISRASRHVFIQ